MRSSRAAYVVLRIFNKGNLCHRKGSMPYKVLLHRDFGAPNPTPADWDESLQSLKAVIYSLGRDGWNFPGQWSNKVVMRSFLVSFFIGCMAEPGKALA